jgi:ankyrin repeat protein
LDELPKTLDETYARTLEEIDEQNWEYAHRLFQCVAAASRPLRVNELAEFLAFDFEAGSTPILLADWRPEDPRHTVLSVCSSLLAIVEPGELSYDGDDDDDISISRNSSIIQFAHFSVKEYLTSMRLSKEKHTISHFHISMTAAHTILAQACLGVLLHLDETVTKDSLEEFPLVEYSAEHWVGHARFENVSSSLQDGMKRLFDPTKRHLSLWTWIYDPQNSERRHEFSEGPEEARAGPLHYATFCGMPDIVKFLIFEHSQDLNARGFFFNQTPLHTALHGGHADIALLLLEHGADAKAKDDEERTPLHLASQGGHVEVVRVLLEHGADMESRDVYSNSPLDRASREGHVEVARVLLEHGADVKAQCEENITALHIAGGEEVARLLLEYGADANALATEGRTPLHFLSSPHGVVRVLLEHGADANARDDSNATPLHKASSAGFHDAVRLLLQYSADIHARDNEGRTPFMRATGGNNHVVIQILLEHGAEDHRAR